MNHSIILLVGLCIHNHLASILLAKHSNSYIPESKKLQIRFSRLGNPTEIITNNEVLNLNSGTRGFVVNNVDPYKSQANKHFEFSDEKKHNNYNLAPAPSELPIGNEVRMQPGKTKKHDISHDTINIDNTHKNQHASGTTQTVLGYDPHRDYKEQNNINNEYTDKNTETTEDQYDDVNNWSYISHNNQNNSGNEIKKPENLSDEDNIIEHLQKTLTKNKNNKPVTLHPEVVQHIIKHLKGPEKKQSKGSEKKQSKGQKKTEESKQKSGNKGNLPETFEEIHESYNEISEEIKDLLLQIKSLKQEIKKLKKQGKTAEAESLEHKESDLEIEKQKLELEAMKQDDFALRKQIVELRLQKEHLKQKKGDLEDLSAIAEKLADLEIQNADLDEEIKRKELDIIENELYSLQSEKERMEHETYEDKEEKEKIKKRIDELLKEEQRLKNDYQVEDELDYGVKEIEGDISEVEHIEGSEESVSRLNKFKRKLKAKRHLIEEQDNDIDTEIQNDVETYENQSQEASEDQDLAEIENNDDLDDKNTQNKAVNKYSDADLKEIDIGSKISGFNYAAISYVLLALANLSSQNKKTFKILPEYQADIPRDSLVYVDELNLLYNDLKEFKDIFEENSKDIDKNIKYLYNAISSVETTKEGIIKFYKLKDRYDIVKENSNKEITGYEAGLNKLYGEFDADIGIFKVVKEDMDSVITLKKLTHHVLDEFVSDTSNEQDLTVGQKSTLAHQYTSKLIEIKIEFEDLYKKIRDNMIILREKRLPLGTRIEDLIRLSKNGETKKEEEKSKPVGKSSNTASYPMIGILLFALIA